MAPAPSKLKVAIVHDWLYGGGAERVVHELHKMYPDAPIYTSYCSDEWRNKLNNKVVTGYLQNWPFNKLRKFLPVLRILWFRSLNLDDYDLVISSTGNGEAKHVRTGSKTIHICYTHTPVHFYWRHYNYYLKEPGFGLFNPLARLGLKLLVKPLRKLDYKAAQNVDYFIANSTHIKKDIKTYYNRDSQIIFPPINLSRFDALQSANRKSMARSGYVTVGRLVPNKRVDILVQACTKLNVPLTVVGRGPDLARLKKIAGNTVSFDTNASDEAVVKYMANAEAFLFASFDDFGITPVEAMAAGTPVIAYKAGGALDYVVPGKTGEFFYDQTVQSLCTTLKHFSSSDYNSRSIQQAAQAFSESEFVSKMSSFIKKTAL